MDVMSSSIILRYNGKEATSITKESNSFSFTDNASGEADTGTISVMNLSGKWMKGFYPQISDYFKAWIKTENWFQGKTASKLYCGKFQVDSLTLSGWPQKAQLKGISIPIGTNFNVTQKNKTWKKTNTKKILADLAKNGGIALVYDAEIYDVDEISQSGQTDLAFAFSVCSEYGMSLKLYNDKMIVYDQTAYEKKAASYTIKKTDLGGEGAYTFTSQITTLYDSVKIQYTKGDKTLTYSYTIPGKSGKRTMFITTKADSYKDAELKAKSKLRKNLRESRLITLKLPGNTKYKAAENFELAGFGRLDGKYFVDKVQHDKAHSKYTCTMTAHPVVTDF